MKGRKKGQNANEVAVVPADNSPEGKQHDAMYVCVNV